VYVKMMDWEIEVVWEVGGGTLGMMLGSKLGLV